MSYRPQGDPSRQYAPTPGPSTPPVWPMPNISGGYNPYGNVPYNTVRPAMSFGQSLFRPMPTPENYSYTGAYNAYPYQPPPPLPGYDYPPQPSMPPMKKQRTDQMSSSNNDYGRYDAGSSSVAWRNCSQPGCKFVGSGKAVEIHEEDRHLIFKPGKQPQRSEEEERFAKRKGPAPTIEGTNITLTTPEDIEKWIAERKAKWPSAKRVAEKVAEQKAAIERGEIPSRGSKRGRGRGGMGGRAHDPAAQAEDWGRAPVERTERDSDARGRGRGRGRGGRGGRGQGGHQNMPERAKDGGWAQKAEITVPVVEPTSSTNESALAAVEDYESSDDVGDSSSGTSSSSGLSSESDSSSESELEVEAEGKKPSPMKTPKPVCKFFSKNGKCNRGDRCNFAHVAADSADKIPPMQQAERRKMPRQPPVKRANPFDRPSMLGALLANPIQNTLSQLSQTIRFLVANNMLENVELEPGQAEDIERENNKVVEIEPAATASPAPEAQPVEVSLDFV